MSTISAVRSNGSPLAISEGTQAKEKKEPSLLDRIAPAHPLTGERRIFFFPERLEIALGGYNYINYIDKQGGPWDNDHYNGIVQDSLKEMIPHTGRSNLPWKITMIDTAVVNAWAKMGGFMGINKSFIERMAKDDRDFGLGYISTADKIRAVIAHEAAHVSLRHSVKFAEILLIWTILGVFIAPFWELIEDSLPFSLESYLFCSYSRAQEFEADKVGMHLMWRCGYDPKAMIWSDQFLKDYERAYGISIFDWLDRMFWTHPTCDLRVKAEKEVLAELEARGPYIEEVDAP